MLSNKHIILGNSGFIGKKLEEYLIQKRESVCGFNSKQINLFYKKSSLKLSKLINKETIIFFLSFNKNQSKASIKDFDKNYLLIKNFIASIKKKKPKKIIFFSSQSVYGEDTHNLNITENTIPNPTSYYGIAKYTAERLLIKFCYEKKISLIVIRIPRVYGLGDNLRNYGPTKFIDFFKKKKQLIVWGSGDEKRDYLYINDLNEIIVKLSKINFIGTINVCSGKSYSFMQIIKLIEDISKKKFPFKRKKRSRPKVDHIMNNNFLIKIIGHYKFSTLKDNLYYLLNN